jgi:sugar phosphate isomerase/epimerase
LRLGIFAKTFDGNEPATALEAVADAGYDCAQFNWACAGLPSMPDEVPDPVIASVRQAVLQSGIELSAVSGTYNMIHPDPQVRSDGLRRLGVVIDSARELRIPMVTLCTGSRDVQDQWRAHPDNQTEQAWRDLIQSMEKALLMAESAGVTLGVEPELANTIDSVDKAEALLRTFDSRYLAIVLDPANLFEVVDDERRRTIIGSAIDRLAPAIQLCHAKDRLADGRFCAAGDGVIDFTHYFACLRETGFSGPMITHGLPADDARRVAQFLATELSRLA